MLQSKIHSEMPENLDYVFQGGHKLFEMNCICVVQKTTPQPPKKVLVITHGLHILIRPKTHNNVYFNTESLKWKE